MKHFCFALAFALTTTSASAQDMHAIAPPQILQMDSLPNAGELLLRFCMIGNHICVERTTSCHGQCCDQWVADSEGYGCSGTVYGGKPPGYHYAGWRCQMYGTPTSSAIPVEGAPGPEPKDIKMCTNFR